MEFVLHIIGTFFIWMCIGWKRTEESEIKIFSKDWWLVVITLIISLILLKTKL
jgi:hypothetical protein